MVYTGRSLGLIVACALLVWAGCVRKGEARDELSLKNSFKEVMTFDAPAAVSGLRAAYWRSRERQQQWLHFVCDDATISLIRKLDDGRRSQETGFTFLKGDDSPDPRDGTSPEAPVWWRLEDGASSLEQITIGQFPLNRNSAVTDIWIDAKRHSVFARRIEWGLPFGQGSPPRPSEKSRSGSNHPRAAPAFCRLALDHFVWTLSAYCRWSQSTGKVSLHFLQPHSDPAAHSASRSPA